MLIPLARSHIFASVGDFSERILRPIIVQFCSILARFFIFIKRKTSIFRAFETTKLATVYL